MYDPITTSLIQSVPALAGLDREGLPTELTRAYASIVSARLMVNRENASPAVTEGMTLIKRLANVYETYAAVLSEHADRDAASFVAATAHSLLALERSLHDGKNTTKLNTDSISSDVSACLLFLSSGYFADAAEVARRFKVDGSMPEEASILLIGLEYLAKGQIGRAIDVTNKVSRVVEDPAEKLYADIGEAMNLMLVAIRDGGDSGAIHQMLHAIQQRCIITLEASERGSPMIMSAFSGPHHFATLLLQAAGSLLGRRMSVIPTPSGITDDAWRKAIAGIVKLRPFLWKSHEEAVISGFLAPGCSAVLSFPTGSGKSTMAELKIASTLSIGKQVLYLAPTHTLVSQITHDLTRAFPGATVTDALIDDAAYSDIDKENKGRIAVMTPERAFTMFSSSPGEFDGIGLIIMDECHLIHPSKTSRVRRSIDAMFCLLAITDHNNGADVLLMSAMMANHNELSDWIAELTGRRCLPLSINWKPTRQVRGCLVFESERIRQLELALSEAKARKKTKAPNEALQKTLRAKPYALFGLKQTWATLSMSDYALLPLMENEVALSGNSNWYLTANRNKVSADVAVQFANRGMRVLVFAGSPAFADSIAKLVIEQNPKPPTLTEEEKQLFRVATEESGGEEHVLGLTKGGALVHHSLLLPVERQLVEGLYRSEANSSLVLVGTPTLAQGINLPAEVVIMAGDDRFDQTTGKSLPLGPEELLNAVARAGRAGHASVGMVLVVPGAFVEINKENQQLGKRWFQLQKDVFSKMDQCLTIDDPFQVMLDIIHDGMLPKNDASYFINKLPFGQDEAKRFLLRSLGAYRARKSMNVENFVSKAEAVANYRAPNTELRGDWVEKLALSSGMNIQTASDISIDILDNAESWHVETVEEVVKRFFKWLTDKPSRAFSFFRSFDSVPEDMLTVSLTQLEQATLLWITGAKLSDIELFLTGKVRPGCMEARKLVLRQIPEVAYGLGVIARAYRLSVGEDGLLPLSLAVATECVKRGLDSAEKLALAHLTLGDHSRAQLSESLSGLELEGSTMFEEFSALSGRIELAMTIKKAL